MPKYSGFFVYYNVNNYKFNLMSTYSKVLTDTSITVNHIAHLLKEASIDFVVKDNVESARLAGFGTYDNNVELHVKTDDEKEAIRIIEVALKAS